MMALPRGHLTSRLACGLLPRNVNNAAFADCLALYRVDVGALLCVYVAGDVRTVQALT